MEDIKLEDPKSCKGCKHLDDGLGNPDWCTFMRCWCFDEDGIENKRPQACIDELGD